MSPPSRSTAHAGPDTKSTVEGTASYRKIVESEHQLFLLEADRAHAVLGTGLRNSDFNFARELCVCGVINGAHVAFAQLKWGLYH
jgi:hypothetical protein